MRQLIQTGTFIEEPDNITNSNPIVPTPSVTESAMDAPESPAESSVPDSASDAETATEAPSEATSVGNFLNKLDNQSQVSSIVFEGVFKQTMTGGDLTGRQVMQTGSAKGTLTGPERHVALNEHQVREGHLIHEDEVRYDMTEPNNPIILSRNRPENPQPSKYRDIDVPVKQRDYKLYADSTVTGEPLIKVSPFKRYEIPAAYAHAVDVNVGDIVTLRYNTMATVPSFRVVWLDFGHRRLKR